MAILRDKEKIGTYVEFSFLKCIPGDYEGCQLNFKYFEKNKKIYELEFGWTNLTIRNYIEVTSKFPLEVLNNFVLSNLYTSFENHLYKLEWIELKEEKTFRLNLSGSQQDFTLIVLEDEVRKFGYDLEAEWKKGLNLSQ